MLPLFRDQLRIGIAPDRISLVRIGKGFRQTIKDKQVVKCEQVSEPAWQAPIDALTKVLVNSKWQNANATVVLSNHFVRYQIVPWSNEISGEQEQMAFVRHCFSKVFGDEVNGWVLRFSEGKAGEPGLASAVDQGLMDGLEQACLLGKLRLDSVQPYLMPTFNQYRRLFDTENAWFILVEKGKLCISLFQDRVWESVSTKLISNEDWTTELPLLLDRQWRLSNLDNHSGKVFILAPGQPELSLPRGGQWIMQQLHPQTRFGFTPKDNARYALAMGA